MGLGDGYAAPEARYRGHNAIAAFLGGGPLSGDWRWRHVRTRANGQPAVGGYTWDAERRTYRLRVLDVLTLRDRRIAAVTAFLDPTALSHFGLTDELELHKQQPQGAA